MQVARAPLWTRAYTLLCSSAFLVAANQSMAMVVTPLLVTHLGGSPFLAGLALLAFSLPSFSLRPIVGHWADTWSLIGVYTVGALLLGLSTLLYLIPVIGLVVLAGAVRGAGWAGAMTGSYTLLAYLSPADRRGEAAGYFSSVFSATGLLFPALGLWLLDLPRGGYQVVFLIGTLLALLGAAISHLGLRPLVQITPAVRPDAAPGMRALFGSLVTIQTGVLLAMTLNLCVMLAQPALSAFLPLYAKEQGIGGIGWFYVLAGVAGLAIRPLLGRAGDRAGRGYALLGGFLFQIVGVAVIAAAATLPAILLGGILNAIGLAVNSGATTALAMDRSDPQRQGAAMATFTISFQLGAGAGAVLAGALVSLAGYRGMFVGACVVLTAGAVLTLANRSLFASPARKV